jgi:hypothetical protein
MHHQLKKKRDRKRVEKASKSKQFETSDEQTYILMSDADDKED